MFFKKKSALFLVHGFTDSIETNFAQFIRRVEARTKIKCIGIDLHGHGINERIEDFDYKKCIAKVEADYIKVRDEYEEVYLLGFSMGGVIASYLANHYGCEKLVLLAPAFKYIESSGLATNLFDIIKTDIKSNSFFDLFDFSEKKRVEKLIEDKYKEERVVFSKYYEGKLSTSLSPYLNFMLLVDKLDHDLVIRNTPTRIYIGELDELVPVKSALYIYRKIITKDKMLKVMPFVYHELLASSLRNELTKEIISFLND